MVTRFSTAVVTLLLVGWAAISEEAPAPTETPAPAPAPAAPGGSPMEPQQVRVSVKIVEYQMAKGVETGLSAYFARRNKDRAYGRVLAPDGTVIQPGRITSGNGAITTADITFPIDAAGGITVFLDRLRMSEGDLEFLLQALVDESRATIVSRPTTMVTIGAAEYNELKTVRNIPYENPTVVGATVVQQTSFRDVGVNLKVKVPELIDDDGDPNTTEDTYVKLDVAADIMDLGSDIVVAVDNRLFGSDAIRAPQFITRSVQTQVWVRHGQVLMLGGLYRNQKIKTLDTVPWLSQAENLAVGMAERVVPGNFLGSPVSSTLGNRATRQERTELVFFIKCEQWLPAYTVAGPHGFAQTEPSGKKVSPKDVITDVIQGISELPQGIAEGISGQPISGPVESELGGIR